MISVVATRIIIEMLLLTGEIMIIIHGVFTYKDNSVYENVIFIILGCVISFMMGLVVYAPLHDGDVKQEIKQEEVKKNINDNKLVELENRLNRIEQELEYTKGEK